MLGKFVCLKKQSFFDFFMKAYCTTLDNQLWLHFKMKSKETKAGFSYDNSVSLQTDYAGYVRAAVLAHVVRIVGLQTDDVNRN